MRLVLDTNVLVAAFISRGVCHELLEHCERIHEMVTSTFILDELEAKLIEKFSAPAGLARAAVALVGAHTEIVYPSPLAPPVCQDPDDDWVLATASVGRCTCLVTGDKDLLTIVSYEGIRIVSPGEFWRLDAADQHSG